MGRVSSLIFRENGTQWRATALTTSAGSACGAIFPLFSRSFLFQNYQSGRGLFRQAKETQKVYCVAQGCGTQFVGANIDIAYSLRKSRSLASALRARFVDVKD